MRQPRTLTRLRPARLALAALALALLPAAQLTPAEAAATCTHSGSVVTCTYGFTGAAETWVVPPGVTQATFQVVGAPGGRSGGADFAHANGGRGADLRAKLTLAPGTPVVITVGGPGGTDGKSAGGFNGGGGIGITGNSYPIAGGGGGASDIRIGGTGLADRVLVAGGGGGGGGYGAGGGSGSSGGVAGGVGGDAGSPGVAGATDGDTTGGGAGGAATGGAGGAGGTAGQSGGVGGSAGVLGQGGNIANFSSAGMGGGGGGGLYGGGSGGSGGKQNAPTRQSGGGGGGGGGASGYTTGFGITDVSLAVDTTGTPKVVITYTDTTAPSVTVNQAGGQADPTDTNPVLFTANFDEPVTGFTASGVALSGTADLSNAAVTVSGGPSSYTISVAGVAGNGTVIAAVAANAATDFAGNGSTASTSTDNSVTGAFPTAPAVTLNPTDQSVNAGVTAIFTAAASGSPAPTVQWQFSTDGGATWFNLAGATSPTLSFTATSGSGTQFRAVFTNVVSSVTTAAATLTVIADTTPPVITPNVAGTLGSNGWYVSDVTLTWTVSDPDSTIASQTGCDPQTITADTPGVTFTCTAASAGGSDSKSVEIKRDATEPIVVSGTPDRGPNAAGWYNAPVMVTFAGSDATSGIASCTSPTYSGPDGASVNVTGTCTDNAGNTSGPVSFGLNYDATAPVLSPSVTPNPASLNQPAAASPNATDATSGVAGASCSQPDTSSAGAKSVSCTAADVAGNTATANAGYSVVNEPPTIAVAPGGTCGDGSASGSIKLTVGDVNTGAAGLTLRLVSNSNTGLVPNSKVLFGGSGANRTMSVTAAAKKSGTAALTIGVSDGANTTNLVVTVIVGTDKNETLNGTGGTDMIFGLLGANTINGLGGNDLLCGGNGVDTINGGEGSDTLYGNRGDDRLTGNSGADFFSGGSGCDTATDFTPGQGDTKDGTVEKVTTITAAGITVSDTSVPDTGTPEIVDQLFLPAIHP